MALGKKMKVISTDAGALLPAKDGRAELMTSWLGEYSELTLCARQAGPLSLVGIPPDTVLSLVQMLLCFYDIRALIGPLGVSLW